jgi:aminoglycoside 2'-N-acetyltransferase I
VKTDGRRLSIRRLHTSELTAGEVAAIKELMRLAFEGDEHGGFSEEDWQHSIGGMHFLLDVDDALVAHASVVARELHIGDVPIRTGYVEAVATKPAQQGEGYGSAVMLEVDSYIGDNFALGALGTGSQGFYERLGWQIWRGPSGVRTAMGVQRTPDEDGYILILPTRTSPALDLDASITCEWRPGDVW